MKGVAGLAVAGATLLATGADAACPNACSGHGTCGNFDQCKCFPDYGGGDCSQRFCPSGWAWVTTNANGDINSDDSLAGFTIYDSDHLFTASGLDYVISQNDPKGAWEQWPAYINTLSKDEGHFYMECSNMGICDRTTGQCSCFEGYTGTACDRSRCPNDCSGHGVCQTVAQQAPSGVSYNLWDKDMSRSCVCDGGYSGPDCSERKCGRGDDPLTTGQVYEKQWVDIYAVHEQGKDFTLGGYFTLTFTDQNGVQWTTDDIAAESMSSDPSAIEAAVEAALNGLPDDVLSGVTVTASYPEQVIAGNVKINTNDFEGATNAATTYVLTSLLVRCEGADANTLIYNNADTNELIDGTGPALTNADDITCYKQLGQGIRLEVSFLNNPGSLTTLSVDTAKVTLADDGLTDYQRGVSKVVGSVSKTRIISPLGAGGFIASFTAADQVSESCTGTGGTADGCVISSQVATVLDSSDFTVGARVKVTCATRVLGTFTISAIGSATTMTFLEDIPDCDPLAANLVVELQSNIVNVNADLTGLLAPGDVLTIGSFADTLPKILSVEWDSTAGTGLVFLDGTHSGDDGAGAESDSDPTADVISQEGAGSTEDEECSGRGLCDRETGICQCFKGYTGWACSIQNALSI